MSNASHGPIWREVAATPTPATPDEHVPVLVVGAGPVGLTLALDLGRLGHRVVVLNRLACVSAGSRAICFAKRTLDIWDRLGVGDAMVERGVVWNVGKVFRGDSPEPIYQFDVLPVKQQKMPGFINLPQYHAEDRLLRALEALPNVEVRWGHEVVGVAPGEDGARVRVSCNGATYQLSADWLVACDGSRSSVRTMLGLDFEGRAFEEHFLIADVRMHGERPAERWFWFDPPFNRGRSALLHKQPDDVWRLDFQLGPHVDRTAALAPETVDRLVRGMLGAHVAFEPVWVSLYTFQCRRMARFVHGRVLFAGDSAHLVSPFGARGCNGGVADAENLAWKLDHVVRGVADARLLESYDHEAAATADENIRQSTRSTDFMTAPTRASRIYRDAVLDLARDFAFARPFVNSGRLSSAVSYPESPLSTSDEAGDEWRGIPPGSPALDAPTGRGWLLSHLGGCFALLAHGTPPAAPPRVKVIDIAALGDPMGLVAERFDLRPGSAYLIRPDQYVAARWRTPTAEAIAHALDRARGALS